MPTKNCSTATGLVHYSSSLNVIKDGLNFDGGHIPLRTVFPKLDGTNQGDFMKKLSWVLMGAFAFNVAQASVNLEMDRAWEGISDPLRMSSNFNRDFTALPVRGNATDPQKYWSSDYWARNKGGINYRWNSSRPTGFNLKSPTKAEAMMMSTAQLASLSPSEKFDLFNGRYDYPVKREVAAYANPSRPSWEGICDGWAAAALNHDEPTPLTLANPDGIQIPFGSSDIKGLLSWYYAKHWSGGYAMMGRRCNGGINIGTDRCQQDMNAGAFHIVLSNRLGVEGISFIADIDRGAEVWNHLAYDYRSTVVSANLPPRSTSASGTVKVARVKTTVHYVYLLARNTWEPVLGTSRQRTISRSYDYYLDLNAAGRIIGGDWISTQRPDFLWLERKVTGFSGVYGKLGQLLREIPVIEEELAGSEAETETEMQ